VGDGDGFRMVMVGRIKDSKQVGQGEGGGL